MPILDLIHHDIESAPVPTSAGGARGWSGGDWAVLLLAWGLMALLAHRFWFVADDAFISFRYARNWAHGLGLRYNLADSLPVEGYSNFLWVVLATVIERLHGDVAVWVPRISFVAGLLLLYWLFRTLRRSWQATLPAAGLAILSLACAPPFALWASSGLETMAAAALMYLTFERLIIRRLGAAPMLAGLAGGALALLRVEGVCWSVLIGLVWVVFGGRDRRPTWRQVLTYFGTLMLVFFPYFLWRTAYFGAALPNTVFVKVGFSGALLWRGLDYVAVYALTFPVTLVGLCGAGVGGGKVSQRQALPVALMAVTVIGYAVAVGGDFMAMGRLLVPALPFVAMLAARWLDAAMAGARGVVTVWLMSAAALVIGVLPAWNVHVVPRTVRAAFHFRHNTVTFRSETEQWVYMRDNTRRWSAKGRILKQHAQPGDSLVSGAIGAVGYYSELHVFDQCGLVEPRVARRRPTGPLMSPGHDKIVAPSFFLEDRPTFMFTRLVSGPGARETVRALADQFRAGALPRSYGPDVRKVTVDDHAAPQYLFVLRLPPTGRSAADLWRAFERRLRNDGQW